MNSLYFKLGKQMHFFVSQAVKSLFKLGSQIALSIVSITSLLIIGCSCEMNNLMTEVDPFTATLVDVETLIPSDGSPGDRFGNRVAISGDTAIVSSRADRATSRHDASVYIFTRDGDTWSQQAKLINFEGVGVDDFGWSVAISGDTAIIGDITDNNIEGAGAVYIFTRTGTIWSQQTKLIPNDAAARDLFGCSVAISGDTVIVGAWGDNEIDVNGFYHRGSAYIFTHSNGAWSQQAKLIPNDAVAGDYVGLSVSINGDTAIVGAPLKDDNGDNSGSAYVFTRIGTNWSQQAKLIPNDGAARDIFSHSVAIDGNTIIIGAYDDDNGYDSGSAYVFVRNGSTWSQQAKLTNSDASAYQVFGCSVSIKGDTAIVGANGNDAHRGQLMSSLVVVAFGLSKKKSLIPMGLRMIFLAIRYL